MIYLRKGDIDSQQTIKIIDEDRLCFLVLSQNRGAQGLRTISKSLLEEFIAYEKQNPEATAQMAREALSGNSDIDKFEYGYNSTLLTLAKLNKTLSKERKGSAILDKVQSLTPQPLQLISSDNPTQFVWSCIKLFNERQDLKQLFDSKYKSFGGSIGNYIRINECYVAQIGKSDIKEIETIQIYDGSFLNAGFDARDIEQFADAVNDVFRGKYKIETEQKGSQTIYKLIQLQINPDYRPYITAIKSKPFLLLAGISGTGKSRIVRKLAQACWPLNSEQRKAQVPANFCMVQVKPNWHDSSELIGYVSRTSGESKFVVGDFLKFVAKAWENWLSEDKKPYFLCLDEMNLAPVEQYFAEYLSVLESRKYNAETGEITSDPIIKKDAEGYSDLLFNLGWKDQAVYDKLSENGICLPPNLIVVGTVNMDETTFSFSRKVLDRAMVIEMNEVNLSGGLRKGADEWDNVELSASNVLPQFVEGKDFYERNEDTCNSIIEKLGQINDVLDGTPFKIAYRTRNEVLLYILNRMSKECSLEQALDEVVNMKILSRIEGDKNKVVDKEGNALLPKLIEVIKGVCGENEKSPSLLKLEEMKKKLDKQFYCSYWN